MTDKQRNFAMTLLAIALFPVSMAYKFADERIKNDVDEDLRVMNRKLKVSFHNRCSSLIYHLIKNEYYRNIFYNRIGKLSYLCRWFLRPSKSFIIATNFGGGVYPAHPFATIVNAKKIGENFVIRQCTTIGNKRDGASDEKPIIGNNVNLGSNVVIIGNITIGDNVNVGAGTVITKDVPSNCTVVGNPFKIINRE